MKIGKKELDSIYDEYSASTENRDNIEVEFSRDINNVDVLVLLRAMSGKINYTDFAPVMETALDGIAITFTLGERTLKSLVYNRGSGNSLHIMFADAPYLYDILQQTIHALLLKKLTPHLENSN